MWNPPNKEDLAKIPALYHNDKKNISLKDVVIHMHFFIGGCDWYVAEFDGEDICFGFTILNGDTQNAEWGNFSLNELKDIKVQNWMENDRDLHFQAKKAREIEKIAECQGWNDD